MGFCPLAKAQLFDKTNVKDIAKNLNKTEA